jgi:type VI secretion system secreted protein VgrG
MPDSLGQDKRIAQLNTPLGKDKLTLVSFACSEGVSEKFQITIEAASEEKGLNFDTAIGQNCTITVDMFESGKRYFDGLLTEAHWLGGREKGTHRYRLVLRPWLWLLSHRRNSFIHHEKTVPEIIEKVFGDHGFAVFSNNLSRGYPTLEYCVQYRESDMDFVCRLMEEYGISYYFRHSDGEHKLIMTDEMSTFEAIAGGSRWYLPTARERHSDKDYFFSWSPARRFTSGKIKLDDYDFKKSDQDLALTESVDPPFDPGMLEVFDYPGRYVESGDGQKIAQAWRDMERSNDHHFNAEGECVTCFPGALVTLEDKSESGFDGEYLALRCVHRYANQAYRSGAATSDIPYEGKYEFVKSDKTYAPPRLTPKAVVQGPQTAKVVGEGEIDVDEYGRILVRFHWDQEEDQSRRCRVAQVWAGKQWGGIYTPRVGMEALVQFLEGDPDQPLVVGCVYNDKHMPPYDLPTDKSISGVKSNSTPGGDGFNEFIFDDKAGEELVRLHAQKDLESVVENDESRNVKMDRKTEVGQNDTLNVIQVLKIDAGTKVEITVGGSKITMTPEKIKIESLAVEISATNFKSDAVMSTHSAGGVMDIKGSLVKINS